MSEPTLFSARWVLPVAGPPIADGAVLVGAEGRIADVAPTVRFDGFAGERVDIGDGALLPGLVNVHAHPELTAFRGLLEDLPFPDWIVTLMRIKRAARPSSAEWQCAALWGCIEAMAAGITTTAATEDSGASLAALRLAGLRGIVYREVFGPDPGECTAALATLRASVTAMRAHETALVRVGISPHAAYTVSDALFAATADYARSDALPIAVHAAEAAVEEALVVHGTGRFADGLRARGIATPARAGSSIALLERTGVLATKPLLIHCVRLRGDDVIRVADAGAAVAHCPTANARLGHGMAPVDELIAAGVCVGLGTDSVASNNRLDILEEARTAQLLLRARCESADALPAERLLALATIDGARALGLDAEIGTLEVGKSADLCAVRLSGAAAVPVHDPTAAVLFAARGADVVLTVVAGRIVYRDGEATRVDVAATRQCVEAFAERLRRQRGASRP